MSTRREMQGQAGFSLGIKAAHSAATVPPGGVLFARNVRGRDMGVLRTRPGTQVHAAFHGLGRVRMLTTLAGTVFMIYEDKLYRLSGNNWVLVSPFSDVGVASRFDSVQWQMGGLPQLYVFSGAGMYSVLPGGMFLVQPHVPTLQESSNLLGRQAAPAEQDLSSPIALSNVATMKFGLQMRAACAYKNRVYLSAPAQPNYWPVEQVIHLPDDGDDVVALEVWFDVLLIFRRNDIWAFIGHDVTSADARLVRQARVGCAARDSIAEVPGVGMVFLGADNVYALTGVDAISERVQVTPLGNDIQPILRMALENSGAVDACAVYHNGNYHLSLSNYGGADRIFVLQVTPVMGWFIDSGPRVMYWLLRDNELYSLGSPPAGLQHHGFEYRSDNGFPISVEVHFGQEKLPVHSRIKKLFLLLQGHGTPQNMRASVIVDGMDMGVMEFDISTQFGEDMAAGLGAIGAARIGRVADLRVFEARLSLKGQFVQLVISASEAHQILAVVGYYFEYVPRPRQRGRRAEVTQRWP